MAPAIPIPCTAILVPASARLVALEAAELAALEAELAALPEVIVEARLLEEPEAVDEALDDDPDTEPEEAGRTAPLEQPAAVGYIIQC